MNCNKQELRLKAKKMAEHIRYWWGSPNFNLEEYLISEEQPETKIISLTLRESRTLIPINPKDISMYTKVDYLFDSGTLIVLNLGSEEERKFVVTETIKDIEKKLKTYEENL
jgi:hypothetical protein